VLVSRKRCKIGIYSQRKTSRKSYMAYQIAATTVTLKVIHRLQAFSSAIRQTFVQHFTRFQLTVCSRGTCASAELLVQSWVFHTSALMVPHFSVEEFVHTFVPFSPGIIIWYWWVCVCVSICPHSNWKKLLNRNRCKLIEICYGVQWKWLDFGDIWPWLDLENHFGNFGRENCLLQILMYFCVVIYP